MTGTMITEGRGSTAALPLRSCHGCGDPTDRGAWCSATCHLAEDGDHHDYDNEDGD